jgi:hypothetical protein
MRRRKTAAAKLATEPQLLYLRSLQQQGFIGDVPDDISLKDAMGLIGEALKRKDALKAERDAAKRDKVTVQPSAPPTVPQVKNPSALYLSPFDMAFLKSIGIASE